MTNLTVTDTSRPNAQQDAARAAQVVQDAQVARAEPEAVPIRSTPTTASPPNRQAILQATAGRERLMANAIQQPAPSNLQPILDIWLNTRPRLSFASLTAQRGGIGVVDNNGKTLVEVALANPLHGAAAIVAALKAEGADLEMPDADGNRLMHRAVLACNISAVQILLANGADADTPNRRTTAAIAQYARSPDEVRRLMQIPHCTWDDGDQATPLHLAAAFSNDPMLIDALAWYVSDIDPSSPHQETPLLWASVFATSTAVVQQLVSHGANVNLIRQENFTLLHTAAMCSAHPHIIIPALIANGAIIEAQDDMGASALHAAAAFSNRRACTALIAAGADINARNVDNQTPVEFALKSSQPNVAEVVETLKNAGADLALPDADGNTLLHRLVMGGDLAPVKILFAQGVDVNTFNTRTTAAIGSMAQPPIAPADMQRPAWRWAEEDEATPLHLAAAFIPDRQLIRALIRAGANPNACNAARDTPLHWAATFSDNADVITTLIDNGAETEGAGARDSAWTPLAAACGNARNPRIATTLIDSGANVNAAGSFTPAFGTIFCNPAAAATLIPALKRAGADLEEPDADGNRLLHCAVMRGHIDSVKALLENGVDVNASNTRTLSAIANFAPQDSNVATIIQNSALMWDEDKTATPLQLAAAFSNNPALIALLLEHGATISASTNGVGNPLDSPLFWAAMFAPNPNVISVLINAGASVLTSGAANGNSLCGAAMFNPDPRMIDVLVGYGAAIESADPDDPSPLHLAASRPTQIEAVRALLRQGACVETSNADLGTPLEIATTISMALESGAIFRELNVRADDDPEEVFNLQQHLESGISNNVDIMFALMEAGGNATSQRRLEADIEAEITQTRNDVVNDDNPDWTPAKKREFLQRFTAESSITLAALRYRPEAQGDEREMLSLALALSLGSEQASSSTAQSEARSATNPAARPAPQSATQQADQATRQRQLADLPRLLNNPRVCEIERWYTDADRASQAARASAWHAICREPHADEFHDFVASLQETAEYRYPQQRPDYVRRVAQLLTAVQNSTELRQQCFLLVEDATISCGDRIGLTLNNLDMARIEHEAEHGQHSAQDLIDIRTSQFRIQILGEVAQRKIAALRATPGAQLDEIEVIHGTVTLMARELNLIGVSRTMLYGSYAHFADEDRRNALALIAQRESQGGYIKFIAEWQPWQKQLRRLRPDDFADIDQRVATERDGLSEQPDYTSDNDYVELCRRMEDMQRERLAFSLENWTREWLVQNRQNAR